MNPITPPGKSKIDLSGDNDDDDDDDDDDVDLTKPKGHAHAHTHGHTQDEHQVPTKVDNVEELDSDEEVDELHPYVDDLFYNLPVTLEELYTGKIKKLAIQRERLAGKKIVKEKRKIEVPVLPGMKDGQEIRFNREGNEKLGYESGDIVITLAANAHQNYERVGNILCYVKNISLYESYAAGRGDINIVIQHLDGTNMILKTDGTSSSYSRWCQKNP